MITHPRTWTCTLTFCGPDPMGETPCAWKRKNQVNALLEKKWNQKKNGEERIKGQNISTIEKNYTKNFAFHLHKKDRINKILIQNITYNDTTTIYKVLREHVHIHTL